jgi:DNA adenine methylase
LSFFPYLGGKQALSRRLLPLIPPHRIYCEPFGGAASLLFAKPRSPVEVYNDLDGELVNLFRIVRDRPGEFKERARFFLYSRELYERWKGEFEEGRAPIDPVERAFRFWYCLRAAYGADLGSGWAFSRKGRPHGKRALQIIGEIEAFSERLKGVYIDHLDFRACFRNWDGPDTFFYVDPPYIAVRPYRIPFSERDHKDLAEILRGARGKWLLTINDCPSARDLYRGFVAMVAKTALGVRKAQPGGSRPRFSHLIIANYDPPKGEAKCRWRML